MNPKEALRTGIKAALYISGLDYALNKYDKTLKPLGEEAQRLEDKGNYREWLPLALRIQGRRLKIAVQTEVVFLYRVSGLDLATRLARRSAEDRRQKP